MLNMRVWLQAGLLFFVLAACSKNEKKDNLKLWYNQPAKVWNEALPVGNGRLAAMIYGDPVKETLQLNEGTFWSGGPSRNDKGTALEVLPKIRELIFKGKYQEAENLVNQKIKPDQLHGSMYQVIGDLNLIFEGHEKYTDYYRELDLKNALFTTSYMVNGTYFKREVFASEPDQVIVVRLSADKKGMLNFKAELDGPLKTETKALDSNTLEMKGISGSHEGVSGQVKFNTLLKIQNQGGTTSIHNNTIKVDSANEVVLLISMATNFKNYLALTGNEEKKSKEFLDNAIKKPYKELLSNHTAAFQKYFLRSHFDIGTSDAENTPTDERIQQFSKTYDPQLVSLYYQFGRYLLISCSQPGGQPANLQGIWNGSTHPAWDSKYTININTEMNYWPAEKCNLSEMHEPLIQMVKELSEAGKKTAKDMYGCDGWVTHHNTDIWRISGLVDGAYWGMWPMGGAWLSQHLWEKYLYSGDLNYLESVYPVMKSACEFYQDFLVEEPKNNWLVVCPSISPEHGPAGRPSVCAGTTMDNQILNDLFSKTIKAAALLNKDADLMIDFQRILDRLPPMQVGQYGQLQEWIEDLDDPNNKHRHISHLYGLYPGNQISPNQSPELFKAAHTTLLQRGDISTGWSMGWKVNFWARMMDGNHALKLIKDQLTLVDPENAGNNGGTYPNFFDAHPPFQIDGNFGCTAGIAEMLMQCHDGAIHVLPALPDEWDKGEISGLRTYGGFELSFKWKDSKIDKIEIKSNLGGNCRIRVPNAMVLEGDNELIKATGVNPNPFFDKISIKSPIINNNLSFKSIDLPATFLYDFDTKENGKYTLVAK